MTLTYRCLGSPAKPALVLLHGFMGSSDDWQELVKYLQDFCYLVLVDLPGHGQSALGVNPGFDDFSCRLDTLFTDLHLNNFSLMGYSLGGRLAMAYTCIYPDRPERLILEGAHAGLQNNDEQEQRQLSDQYWSERFNREPIEQVLEDWYQQPVFSDLTVDQRQALVSARLVQKDNDLARTMMVFSLSGQPDYRENLRHLPCPVHYLAGELDKKFSGIGRSLHKEHCLTDMHLIPSSGHNIHREQPKAMASKILEIMNIPGRLM